MIPFYPVYMHTVDPDSPPPKAWPLFLAVGLALLTTWLVLG